MLARLLRLAPLAAAALAALAVACASPGPRADAARAKDEEALAAKAAELAKTGPRPWVVVQGGAIASYGFTADDALRAAAPAGGERHRFVFRAEDRGERLWRLTFLPDGGTVAGRRTLADLGFRVVGASGSATDRRLVVERRGTRRTIDLAKSPRLRLDVSPLGGGAASRVEVPLDPDFDGPLVLPAAAAAPFDVARAEIPGRAEVHVAVGRPFEARRAWVAARCAELDASGVIEVAVRE